MEGVSSIKIPEGIVTPRISVMQAIRQQSQTHTFFHGSLDFGMAFQIIKCGPNKHKIWSGMAVAAAVRMFYGETNNL